MSIMALVFAALLLGLPVLLLLPVVLRVELRFNGKTQGLIRIAGIIPIRIGRGKKQPRGDGKKEEPGKDEISEKESVGPMAILEFVLDPAMRTKAVGALWRLLKRLARVVKIRLNEADIVYGAGDPHKTAMMLGRFYAFVYSARFLEGEDRITFKPDFKKKKFEGFVDASIRFYLGRLLFYLGLFLLEWPVLRTLRLFKRG